MTNNEIRNQINEATKDFRETTRKVNEALNHAAGRLDKAEKEAYDRGLNDCWEMFKKIKTSPGEGGISIRDLHEIFGSGSNPYLYDIIRNYSPQQALAKIRAWEEKKAEEEREKQEEAEKIQIGDVVECYIRDDSGFVINTDLEFVGIYCGEDNTYYWAINNRCSVPQRLSKERWLLKKTGEHVDIVGALK